MLIVIGLLSSGALIENYDTMNSKALAREILEKYYHTEDKPVRIVLNDGSTQEGFFVGYYHDDVDAEELLPDCWHFILEDEQEDYQQAIGNNENFGRMIRHEEIKSVEFK